MAGVIGHNTNNGIGLCATSQVKIRPPEKNPGVVRCVVGILANITMDYRAVINRGLEDSGLTAAEASRRAVGNPYFLYGILKKGHVPSVEKLEAICRILGIEFQIGPPRDDDPASSPTTSSPAAPPLLAKGASLQDVVQAIEQRLSGKGSVVVEELRDEIISALKSETKVLRDEISEPLTASQAEIHEEVVQLRNEIRSVRDELTITMRNEATGEVTTLPDPELEDSKALAHPGVVEGHDPASSTLCNLGFHLLPWRCQVRSAAGGGALVEDETVEGYLAFREEWLQKKHVSPEQSSIIEVLGDSMEPTLGDGSAILVDHRRTRRRHDRIFVVRTEEGLLVKRLMHDNHDWLLVSDNTHYKPLPWPQEAKVIGQVMWTGRTLA